MRLTDARQLKWNSWLYDSWILIPGKVHSIYIYHVTKFASYLWQVRGPWFNRITVESCLKHPLKNNFYSLNVFYREYDCCMSNENYFELTKDPFIISMAEHVLLWYFYNTCISFGSTNLIDLVLSIYWLFFTFMITE